MEGEIIVGTVRATRGNGRHVVVRRDGSTVDVAFHGQAAPLIGGDVVGTVKYDDFGAAHMTLRRTLAEILLEGNARIFPMGMRPDLTARVLSKVLARSRSAVLAPGAGLSMERMPISCDPDLAWAMAAFQPEAERLSIALNVVDVKAVSRSPWQPSALRDLALPADIEGSRRTVYDLTRLLRSGFHPDCNRMVENHTGNRAISVNFVLPYSPFAGALGFARDVAAMDRGVFPLTTLTLEEARKLGAARNVALALAHASLGAGRGVQADVEASPRAAHMANCFADAAAALAFLSAGGRAAAVAEYADLKEASLFHGYVTGTGRLREGVLEQATHASVRAAAALNLGQAATAQEIVAAAARIARRHALPAARFTATGDQITHAEAEGASQASSRVGFDLRKAGAQDLAHLSGLYAADLEVLVKEHGNNAAAASRLVAFGAVHAPLRLDRVFDRIMESMPRPQPVEISASGNVIRDRLADRIRSARAEEDDIQFGEPAFGP